MAQFDVYENLNERTKNSIPFLLDIQNDVLKNLFTRVVIPLVVTNQSINFLNPKFTINQIDVILSTAELASIPMEILGNKICSLKGKREEIIGAVDFLVTGFG
ncbi:MAG: CcdB family protein [Candidatus Altimarinota bacterium]